MNQKNLIVIGVIIIIAISLIFYIIGYSVGKNSANSKISYLKKVIDSISGIPRQLFSVSGEIIKIENNFIEIETIVEDRYKLEEEWENTVIKVNIDDESKFFKTDPEKTELKEISFSDLKTNNRVTINSIEEITNKTEIKANTIFITNDNN